MQEITNENMFADLFVAFIDWFDVQQIDDFWFHQLLIECCLNRSENGSLCSSDLFADCHVYWKYIYRNTIPNENGSIPLVDLIDELAIY